MFPAMWSVADAQRVWRSPRMFFICFILCRSCCEDTEGICYLVLGTAFSAFLAPFTRVQAHEAELATANAY